MKYKHYSKDAEIDGCRERGRKEEGLHVASLLISPLLDITSSSCCVHPIGFCHRSAFHPALCKPGSLINKITCFHLTGMYRVALIARRSKRYKNKYTATPLMTLNIIRKIEHIHQIVKTERVKSGTKLKYF